MELPSAVHFAFFPRGLSGFFFFLVCFPTSAGPRPPVPDLLPPGFLPSFFFYDLSPFTTERLFLELNPISAPPPPPPPTPPPPNSQLHRLTPAALTRNPPPPLIVFVLMHPAQRKSIACFSHFQRNDIVFLAPFPIAHPNFSLGPPFAAFPFFADLWPAHQSAFDFLLCF